MNGDSGSRVGLRRAGTGCGIQGRAAGGWDWVWDPGSGCRGLGLGAGSRVGVEVPGPGWGLWGWVGFQCQVRVQGQGGAVVKGSWARIECGSAISGQGVQEEGGRSRISLGVYGVWVSNAVTGSRIMESKSRVVVQGVEDQDSGLGLGDPKSGQGAPDTFSPGIWPKDTLVEDGGTGQFQVRRDRNFNMKHEL